MTTVNSNKTTSSTLGSDCLGLFCVHDPPMPAQPNSSAATRIRRACTSSRVAEVPLELGTRGKRRRRAEERFILIAYLKAMRQWRSSLPRCTLPTWIACPER